MFVFLWAIIGIVLFHIWTPYWLKKYDPVGFYILHFGAAFSGPFMLFLFFFDTDDKTDRKWNEEERKKNKL